MLMIGDRGSLATVAALLVAANRSGGTTTLSAIDAVVVPTRNATSRRVRALIEWLQQCGDIKRAGSGADKRRRPIRSSDALVRRLNGLARTLIDDVNPLEEAAGTDPILDIVVEAIVAAALNAVRLPPEIAWPIEHRGGYPLMLRLIGEAIRLPDGTIVSTVSRKAGARRYGLSRAHITTLLTHMEQRGWLTRSAGETIVLDPDFDAIWLEFVDRQLTAVRDTLVEGERSM